MAVGENIRRLRKKKKWSQTELAKKTNSHLSHINRIEAGKYKPSLDVLVKIAWALEVSLDALVNDDGEFNEVKIEDKNLYEKIKLINSLDLEDRKALIRVIDSMLTKSKILQLVTANNEIGEKNLE